MNRFGSIPAVKMDYSVTSNLTSYFKYILNPSHENAMAFMSAVDNNEICGDDKVVYMGLADTESFTLWKIFGANIPGINTYFGPIIVLTNPMHAEQLLKIRKNTEGDLEKGENGWCIGNRSAAVIRSQVGKNNLFGTDNTDDHMSLRITLKNAVNATFSSNVDTGIKDVMYPYVVDWINRLKKLTQFSIKGVVDELVAMFFVRIVLGKDPYNTDLGDVTKTMENFVETVVNPIKSSILSLRKSDIGDAEPDLDSPKNLPHIFESLKPGCAREMMIMLEKVGYSNIHSAISSLLYRMATNPIPSGDIVGSDFFFETMRLAPPVWLQARKIGSAGLKLEGLDKKFPPYSLVIVPNFILGRKMRGDTFDPTKVTVEEKRMFNPFSFASSPNACAGRLIATPFINLVFRELANVKLCMVSTNPAEFKGDVALRFKDEILLCVRE